MRECSITEPQHCCYCFVFQVLFPWVSVTSPLLWSALKCQFIYDSKSGRWKKTAASSLSLCCCIHLKWLGAGHDRNASEANVKFNEKQGCEVSPNNVSLCFRQSPKAILSCISVYEQMIWSLWFVSGNRPPTRSVCSQWHPCVQTDTQRRGDKSSWHFVVINSCCFWAERGESLVVGPNQGSPFFPCPPPAIRGSGRIDPSLGKRNLQMNSIRPGQV